MKTPFGRMWSMLRGDKYMFDAYPAPPDPVTPEREPPVAVPPKEQ